MHGSPKVRDSRQIRAPLAALGLGIALLGAGSDAAVLAGRERAPAEPGAVRRASAPAQSEPPHSVYLPALARPGLAPAPRDESLHGLVSGLTSAVTWDDGAALVTIGRSVAVVRTEHNPPPSTVSSRSLAEVVRLPGVGRAVVPIGDSHLAVLASVPSDTPSPPPPETPDSLLIAFWRIMGHDDNLMEGGGVSASIVLAGPSVDVRAADGTVYVAVSSPPLIQIFDVRDRKSPRELSRIPLESGMAPQDLELAGTVLWVSSAGQDGTRVDSFAVSNPAAPEALGGIPLPPTGGRRAMLTAVRERLFVVSAEAVLEVDASDPSLPQLVGPIGPETPCLSRAIDVVSMPAAVGPPQMAVQGVGCLEWRAFIAGSWLVDKSATSERAYEFPAAGSPLAAGPAGLLAAAHGVAGGATEWTAIPPAYVDAPGTAACTATHGDGLIALAGDALWFFATTGATDGWISVTAPPARLGFSNPVRCGLASSEHRVVIAADDLYTIVDVSDPARPEAGRASRIPQLNGAVAADARRAYLTAGANGLLVRALDPDDTIRGGVLRTEGVARDVAFSAGHLFVADGPAGITVYDATGEELPRLIATLPLRMDALALHHADGMLAVTLVRSAESHRWWQGNFALALVDVTSPLKPELRSVLDLDGASPGRPTMFAGLRQGPASVLVPAGDRLHSVDVTNPLRPRLEWTAAGSVRDVAAARSVVIAALGDAGLAALGSQ